MNREQKIALIVGFAVVLVVGVLVSDHLSGARQLEIAEATEGDPGVLEVRPVAVLPTPDRGEVYAAGGASEAIDSRDGSAAVEPVRPAPIEPTRIQLGSSDGAQASPLGDVITRAMAGPPPREETARAAPSGRSWAERVRAIGEEIANGFESGVPAAAAVETAVVSGDDGRDARTPESEPVRHTVRKNESLFKLAKRYLGDGNRWREIAAANPGKVGANGSVREGVTLVIPGAEGEARPERERSAPAAAAPTRYTVKQHDSLSEISQRLLGSAKRMGEIVEANRGVIDDPDDIRVGMVLKIPARS